ncbi:MAG: hypothetical protein ABIA04_06285 [Pseudomonadota bacterium]
MKKSTNQRYLNLKKISSILPIIIITVFSMILNSCLDSGNKEVNDQNEKNAVSKVKMITTFNSGSEIIESFDLIIEVKNEKYEDSAIIEDISDESSEVSTDFQVPYGKTTFSATLQDGEKELGSAQIEEDIFQEEKIVEIQVNRNKDGFEITIISQDSNVSTEVLINDAADVFFNEDLIATNYSENGVLEIKLYPNALQAIDSNGSDLCLIKESLKTSYSVDENKKLNDIEISAYNFNSFDFDLNIDDAFNFCSFSSKINMADVDLNNDSMLILNFEFKDGQGALSIAKLKIQLSEIMPIGDSILSKIEVKNFGYNCATVDKKTYCKGENNYGEAGLGNADPVYEYSEIDLGTDRYALYINAPSYNSCAILDNGDLKCWGMNDFGQLGLGDYETRGDDDGEMGDKLPAIDLGEARQAISVGASWNNCALTYNKVLDKNEVMCWGYNEFGQVGVESSEISITTPQLVDLGSDSEVVKLKGFGGHTCAIFENGKLKCFGHNGYGQLGYEDNNHRGDEAGEMGDLLAYINLGENKKVVDIAGCVFGTCAVLDSGEVKCWGGNTFSHLNPAFEAGEIIGDEAGEMGDNLISVDFSVDTKAIEIENGGYVFMVKFEDGSFRNFGDSYLQATYGDISQAIDFGFEKEITEFYGSAFMFTDGTFIDWGYSKYDDQDPTFLNINDVTINDIVDLR